MFRRFYSSPPSVKGIVNALLRGDGSDVRSVEDNYTKGLTSGKKVHQLLTHSVKPEAMEDYKDLIRHYHKIVDKDEDIPMSLFGSFTVDVGQLDTGVTLWEYENFNAIAESEVQLKRKPEYVKLNKQLLSMLRSRESQIMFEFAFRKGSPPTEDHFIYEMRSYLLKPGRMLEWEQEWSKGLQARKQFVEPIGCFFAQIGQLNTVFHFWPYQYF